KRIGSLNEANRVNQYDLFLNANSDSALKNQYFYVEFSLTLNDKSINYLETERHKSNLKEVNFKAFINVSTLHSNIRIANVHLAEQLGSFNSDEFALKYKYVHNYKPQRTDLWLLSGNDSPAFMIYKFNKSFEVEAKIDLMNWVNEFIPYLETGNILVLELIQPNKEITGSKKFIERYAKAQNALFEIEKHMKQAEWKAAIIASRPIVELFKKFDEFKTLLTESGYSEPAYNNLKQIMAGFFDLLSKFHHGLAQNSPETNPDIHLHREDAYFVYSHCVSLLNLISQKTNRAAK
ncbi:MAG: hypothetical protein ACXVED_17475, partial [Bacteroidia bacterium]